MAKVKLTLAQECRDCIEEGGGEANDVLARAAAALEEKDEALREIEKRTHGATKATLSDALNHIASLALRAGEAS
jgi:phosphoserine phosphatase